jgi:DNA (cytosine-5)-methyltransferase 1
MRYASVCDGIGAAHVAWQPLGWQCSWTSEIEPFPAAVVEHHFGFPNVGDMTKITEEMLDGYGPVDLLVGGTPCQSFSVAGLRGGLADPRGNLALRFVQLAAVMQPKWIVWENVPGVLSSGKGRDFGTFLGALGELGYGFAYRILDAQWHGVAQRRRRVFVVGHLGDWRRAAAVLFERESVFGNPPTRGKTREDATGSTGDGVARCVTTGESKRQDWETCNFVAAYDITGVRATIGGRLTNCHTALRARPPGHSEASTTTVVAFKESQSGCRTSSVHATLDANKGSRRMEGVMAAMAVRRLTPRECERLQGFPDDYTLVEYRKKPAADGPRYRALGNSMAVPVMRWIGERIKAVDELR